MGAKLKLDSKLEHLVKEQMKKDYTKTDTKFVLPVEGYKNIIYAARLDTLPLDKESSIILYMIGDSIVNILNEVGYYKWLPDFIKDNAIKLLLQKITEDKQLLGSIMMKVHKEN